MAIELTPDVSPESGGFGFQVPVFRMNQGVNAATANPLSRGAMGQPMDMVSESQFGLNPNVLAMADEAARQQFYTGVDELNQFVNKAAEFGIDPSKVDMASPESFALNQEFRKRVQALQQQARGITTGAAQQAIVEREEQKELMNLQKQEALLMADYQRGERYLTPFSNLEKSFYQTSLNQDPSQRKSVAELGNKLIGSYQSSIEKIGKATNINEETKSALIGDIEGRIEAAQQLIQNPVMNQPQVVKPEKPEGPTPFEISNSPDLEAYQSGAFGRGVKYGNADLFGFKFEGGKLVVIGSEEVKSPVVEENKEGKSVIKRPGTYEVEKPINSLAEAIKIINSAYSDNKVGDMVKKDLIKRAKTTYFNPNLLNPSKK